MGIARFWTGVGTEYPCSRAARSSSARRPSESKDSGVAPGYGLAGCACAGPGSVYRDWKESRGRYAVRAPRTDQQQRETAALYAGRGQIPSAADAETGGAHQPPWSTQRCRGQQPCRGASRSARIRHSRHTKCLWLACISAFCGPDDGHCHGADESDIHPFRRVYRDRHCRRRWHQQAAGPTGGGANESAVAPTDLGPEAAPSG